MKNKVFLQIGNFTALIFTIIVNSLANILPINNKTTAELSDALPNLFVPSGITFSIWGVIYVLLIIFVIYQIRDVFKKEKIEMPFIEKISVLFILASLANIAWIFLWHYKMIFYSLIVMLGLFLCLLGIYLRLGIGKTKVSLSEKICIHVPFSVYLGWITVATIANITAVLVNINWDGFGISSVVWTIIVLIVASLVTLLVIVTRKDVAYSLVIIWALIGIFIKQSANEPIIANTAIFTSLIIFIIAIITGFKEKIPKKKGS